jgi:hypothetical protein
VNGRLLDLVLASIPMATAKADITRWARGQRLAQGRIAKESRDGGPSIQEALERVDDLRDFADNLSATVDRERAERENLAFHLTWARVRRAFGVG